MSQRGGRNGGGGSANPFDAFGFGRSMMQDFLGRDPFDDPFFTRPFNFGENFFSQPNFSPFLDQRAYNPPPQQQQEARRGPVIEEIDDHHDDGGNRSRQEPIVEHPDDDVRTGASRRRRHTAGGHQAPLVNHGGNGAQTFSFQSSAMSIGGPDGQQYVSASARTAGPNGVVREEHYEKDTAAKREAHRLAKGIYDKGRSVTRKRAADGREETSEMLHNLGEAEVPEFDKKWQSEAERSLPAFARGRPMINLGDNGGNSGSRRRAALPTNSSGARRP